MEMIEQVTTSSPPKRSLFMGTCWAHVALMAALVISILLSKKCVQCSAQITTKDKTVNRLNLSLVPSLMIRILSELSVIWTVLRFFNKLFFKKKKIMKFSPLLDI
jgi:hypothetical protein